MQVHEKFGERSFSKTFFLHVSLAKLGAHTFTSNGTNIFPGDKKFVSVRAPISAFQNFVRWLYGSELGASAAPTVPALWQFSKDSYIPFANYLLEWCHEYCRTGEDQLRLLQLCIAQDVCLQSLLPKYLLENLAFQIASKGWLKVIRASTGQWERFVNMRCNDRISRTKEQYMLRLIKKIESADQQQMEGNLKDPASSKGKWHIHGIAADGEPCETCTPD